jgi:hypothetical protein
VSGRDQCVFRTKRPGTGGRPASGQSLCTDGAINVAPPAAYSYRPDPMTAPCTTSRIPRTGVSLSRALLSTAACSVLLGACGNAAALSHPGTEAGHRGAGPAASPTPERGIRPVGGPPPSPPAAGPVVSAWLSAEQSFDSAALTSDPDAPDLAATTIDPQLSSTRSLLSGMRAAGQIARGPVHFGAPTVTVLKDGRATVRACVFDQEIVESATSGRPAPGIPGQVDFELFTSTMALTSSGWKLLGQRVGVAQCHRA